MKDTLLCIYIYMCCNHLKDILVSNAPDFAVCCKVLFIGLATLSMFYRKGCMKSWVVFDGNCMILKSDNILSSLCVTDMMLASNHAKSNTCSWLNKNVCEFIQCRISSIDLWLQGIKRYIKIINHPKRCSCPYCYFINRWTLDQNTSRVSCTLHFPIGSVGKNRRPVWMGHNNMPLWYLRLHVFQ